MGETQEIRGHHLRNIGMSLSQKELGQILVNSDYVPSKNHVFVSKSFKHLRELRKNPNKVVKIIAGKNDFFCSDCPNPEKYKCTPLDKISYGAIRDKELAEKAGLKIGRKYTIGKILELTREQTLEFETYLRNNFLNSQ